MSEFLNWLEQKDNMLFISITEGKKKHKKDITNLFMNNFLLSTTKIPKITIFTAPKNDSTDTVPGVFNAKIEYYFLLS